MTKSGKFAQVVALLLVLICISPYIYVFLNSLRSVEGEWTLKYYYQTFLGSTQFLMRFWKSLFLCAVIAAGQMVVSTLAGFGFAKYRFPGKNLVFFLLMILMIMPLQVTLVPNYIILNEMGLMNTYRALALPAIFVPLGTFIMTQSFKSIPNEILEAARLDGCGIGNLLIRIAVPMNKSGLICTMLLSFLDGWNMVEQPMVYIEEFLDLPIAVALASVPPENPTVQLVCCMLVIIPPLALFCYFNRELVEGIVIGKEK